MLAVSLFLFSCVSDGNQDYDNNGGVVEVSEMQYFDDSYNGEKVPMEEVEMASLKPIKGSVAETKPSYKPKKQSYKKQHKKYRRQLTQGNKLYVQAGSFGVRRNAERLVKRLSGIGNPKIHSSSENRGRKQYKVLFSVPNIKEGKKIISKLKNMGHKGFMIKR